MRPNANSSLLSLAQVVSGWGKPGDAGHRANAATTRVYVQLISGKRDKYSEKVLGRFAKK
jgi:hypothetical protein